MKSNTVFHINEIMVRFLQVSSAPKKLVTGVDLINIDKQTDEEISATLAAFVQQQKLNFTENRVTVVIPRSRAILRNMTFPSHNDDEIRSMVDLQIGNYIPYLKEDVEIDFQILSKTADGYATVAVVIIPQEIARRYWKIFTDAKIPVDAITISSIGLWLLYQQQAQLSDRPGAVFDLDVDHSEICLCYQTHWLTSREIPIGFVEIEQDGCVQMLNQWELTQGKVISSEKSSEVIETVYLVCSANRAHALALEMVKKHKDLTINEILLTQTLTLARGVQWPKPMIEEGVSIASLAGVAFSPEATPINLIPRAIRQTQMQLVYRSQLVILGVWVVAALISLGLALGIGFFRKNLELAQLENKLHDTKRKIFRVKDQLQKIYDIEGMINGRLIFADLAREMASLLPAQVYLVNITISDGHNLSLQGVSSNPLGINQFQKDMVNSQRFSNVGLEFVNKRITQEGEVDYFKITCTFNPETGQK